MKPDSGLSIGDVTTPWWCHSVTLPIFHEQLDNSCRNMENANRGLKGSKDQATKRSSRLRSADFIKGYSETDFYWPISNR
jgi:hypothetical protein